MKRFFSFAAAALLTVIALSGIACSMNDARTTPAPSANPTADATRDSMLLPSSSPSASPDVSASPNVSGSPDVSTSPLDASASPDMSAEPSSMTPDASLFADGIIEGFSEGKVVDPAGIPDITAVLEREFPGHGIQSVTHELFGGSQTYRIVLQGDGELSKVLYVFPNGSILLPAAAD